MTGTVAVICRKTTGREKGQLDKNVESFHAFKDQLKSWHLAESKVKKLGSDEIGQCKRKCKNIEKHNPTAESNLANVFSFVLIVVEEETRNVTAR